MELLFDTSAVVPLLLSEPHSKNALRAWAKARRVWAWRWLQVETEAALSRRKAPAVVWRRWADVAASFSWLDLSEQTYPQLRAFNRPLKLRAADAGHLYIFQTAAQVVPGLKFVCFDVELRRATKLVGLELF